MFNKDVLRRSSVFSDHISLSLQAVSMHWPKAEVRELKGSVVGNYTGVEMTAGDFVPVVESNDQEVGRQLKLDQNKPNPYVMDTTIPFTLQFASYVKLELWDLMGKKVAAIDAGLMAPGEQLMTINPVSLGLRRADYVYQLEVRNNNGVFRTYRAMSAQ